MSIRDRMYQLVTPEEVNEFVEKFPTSAIFKAGGCHKTMQGFSYVEEALNPHEGVNIGFIRVIESRPASNHVADLTGITHQSPQLILFVDGKPVFDVDNWEITQELVESAAEAAYGAPTGEAPQARPLQNVSDYIALLEKYVEGNIAESEFEGEWLTTFQKDATPRSKEEFDLLNSLYGDVDAAIAGGGLCQIGASPVKGRAERLLGMLKAAI